MKRPKLLHRFDGTWYVSVPIANELADIFRGLTPAEAIAEALPKIDTVWCRTCAGTGVSPHWDGTGLTPNCSACGGNRRSTRGC